MEKEKNEKTKTQEKTKQKMILIFTPDPTNLSLSTPPTLSGRAPTGARSRPQARTPFKKLDKTSTQLHTRQHVRPVLLPSLPRKNTPETKCLITGTSHDGLSRWVHRQEKHTAGVSSQGRHFLQSRVLPNDNLVVRVAMGTHDFLCILREHKVAHL